MQNLAKDTVEMVVLLHRSRKYLTLSAIFYPYKCQIRPKMAHCIRIWPEVAKSRLSSFDSVQNRFHRLVGMIYFPPYILFPTNTALQAIQFNSYIMDLCITLFQRVVFDEVLRSKANRYITAIKVSDWSFS